MGQEGVMTERRRFSAGYKREAVAMLDVPGSGNNLTRHTSAGPVMPCRGRLAASGVNSGHEGAGFFARNGHVLRERGREEVSDDPTVPHRVSHPDDVPILARLPQRVLRLGHAAAECADSSTPRRPIRRRGADVSPENDGRLKLR
jgi:hypothetical protein